MFKILRMEKYPSGRRGWSRKPLEVKACEGSNPSFSAKFKITMIKKEISSGAVIYKIFNNEYYFLIEYMSLGHISLCKGHVENNETLLECAYREIKEETSLDVIIDTNFEHIITYSPYENVIKDVHFFIARVISNNEAVDSHDNEVKKIEFLPFIEAYNLLTYNTDKETLLLAKKYLKELN